MKRSRSLVLTSLMAGAGMSMTACDQSATHWGQGGGAAPPSQAVAYRSLEECRSAGEPAADCERAQAQAQAANDSTAPRFNDRQSCEQRYGVEQCVPRAQAGGGNVFMPLLAGFLIGRALNGGGLLGAPVYRDRNGGFLSGGGGGYGYGGGSFGRYVTGRPSFGDGGGYDRPSVFAPSRVQSRSAVISRGGFGGGGGRSFGFGG